MGKIIRNGIEYSGTRDTANNINYDGTLSGLNANTVQEAIDEVNNKLKNGGGGDLSILQWYIDNGWLPAIPAEGEVPANLEDCSWNMISQLVKADTFKNYYKIGDTKSITLSSGEVVYMQVASINDGSGDAGAWYPKGTVDFISKDCLQTMYQVNTTATNSGGWGSSNLRTQLNSGILNSLPLEVTNVITEKSHVRYLYGGTYGESTDKLWLPTYYEMVGVNPASVIEKVDCNIWYPLFPDGNSRLKRLGTNGNIVNWWTSSINNANVKCFSTIGTTGVLGWNEAQVNYGIPLCFRVG